jgi:hypothetical protein
VAAEDDVEIAVRGPLCHDLGMRRLVFVDDLHLEASLKVRRGFDRRIVVATEKVKDDGVEVRITVRHGVQVGLAVARLRAAAHHDLEDAVHVAFFVHDLVEKLRVGRAPPWCQLVLGAVGCLVVRPTVLAARGRHRWRFPGEAQAHLRESL